MRRKALQEEIDRESGKTETSEPRKWMVSLPLWSGGHVLGSVPCSMRRGVGRTRDEGMGVGMGTYPPRLGKTDRRPGHGARPPQVTDSVPFGHSCCH
jgi:hypothetical protein